MKIELRDIDSKLKHLHIPEFGNEIHEQALRRQLSIEILNTSVKRRFPFSIPVLRAAVPLAIVALLFIVMWIFFFRQPGLSPSTINIIANQGTATIEDFNGVQKSVATGGLYSEGTTLSTDKSGSIEFSLGKKSTARLKASSQLNLKKLDYADIKESTTLILSKGEIECNVDLPGSDSAFRVYTEYTNISVHGTIFTIAILENRDVLVTLSEGVIEINNYFQAEALLDTIKESSPLLYSNIRETISKSLIQLSAGQTITISHNRVKELNEQLLVFLSKVTSDNQTDVSPEHKENIIQKIDTIIEQQTFLHGEEEATPGEKENSSHYDNNSGKPSSNAKQKKELSNTQSVQSKKMKGTDSLMAWYKTQPSSVYQWADGIAYSGQWSLQISSSQKEDKEYSWAYTATEELPYDKLVTFSVFIKTDAIKGKGICLSLRADDTLTPKGNAEMYATTQGKTRIIGNSNWTEYKVTFATPLHENIKSISIYCTFLPNTTGAVFFDDASISYPE